MSEIKIILPILYIYIHRYPWRKHYIHLIIIPRYSTFQYGYWIAAHVYIYIFIHTHLFVCAYIWRAHVSHTSPLLHLHPGSTPGQRFQRFWAFALQKLAAHDLSFGSICKPRSQAGWWLSHPSFPKFALKIIENHHPSREYLETALKHLQTCRIRTGFYQVLNLILPYYVFWLRIITCLSQNVDVPQITTFNGFRAILKTISYLLSLSSALLQPPAKGHPLMTSRHGGWPKGCKSLSRSSKAEGYQGMVGAIPQRNNYHVGSSSARYCSLIINATNIQTRSRGVNTQNAFHVHLACVCTSVVHSIYTYSIYICILLNMYITHYAVGISPLTKMSADMCLVVRFETSSHRFKRINPILRLKYPRWNLGLALDHIINLMINWIH